MGEAKSDFAFPDCRAFLDAALAAEKGYRAVFAERGEATNFRLRCYTARRRELVFNMRYYTEPGDEVARKTTRWDELVLLIREVRETVTLPALPEGQVYTVADQSEGSVLIKPISQWAVLAVKAGPGALEAVTIEQGPIL